MAGGGASGQPPNFTVNTSTSIRGISLSRLAPRLVFSCVTRVTDGASAFPECALTGTCRPASDVRMIRDEHASAGSDHHGMYGLWPQVHWPTPIDGSGGSMAVCGSLRLQTAVHGPAVLHRRRRRAHRGERYRARALVATNDNHE